MNRKVNRTFSKSDLIKELQKAQFVLGQIEMAIYRANLVCTWDPKAQQFNLTAPKEELNASEIKL